MIGCKPISITSSPDFAFLTERVVAGKVICHAALGLYMLSINRRRDRQLRMDPDVDEEKVKREAERRGMLDQTEFENEGFRYVL